MKRKRDSDSKSTKRKSFPKINISTKSKRKLKSKIGKSKSKLQKRKLVCEKCEEHFKSWWDIRDHWLTTGHKTPDQCRWCQKKTFALQSHLCKQHWNVASMCSFCGQMFMFKEDLERHKIVHDETEYRCFLCGRRRKDENLLRSHILNHYLYEKYGCNMCEKRFKRKKNMERHLKGTHFLCQYCGRACSDKSDLMEHVKIHDDLTCVLCLKKFSQKNRLKYHYQLMHGHQDFYKCTICFKRFVIKGRLLDHMKLRHNGVSNFMCKICNAPFLYWKLYQNHFEQMHARVPKESFFKCSFCDFVTDNKLKLKWHIERASGSGFFCKKCKLKLECKTVYDKHIETHKEDNGGWRCEHCSRSYTCDNSLKHHISVAHPQVLMKENPNGHPCLFPHCNKYYTTKNSLSRHLRKNHSSINVSTCSENTVVCSTPLITERSQRKGSGKSKQSTRKSCEFEESVKHKGYHHMLDDPPEKLEVDVHFCGECKLCWFSGNSNYKKHMEKHNEDGDSKENCGVCDFSSQSPEKTVKHIVEEHLKVKFILS